MGIKGENRGAGEGDLGMATGPLEEGYRQNGGQEVRTALVLQAEALGSKDRKAVTHT